MSERDACGDPAALVVVRQKGAHPVLRGSTRLAKRQAVNDWIRTSGAFDGVIDFDAALEDPENPGRMQAAFDKGDNLHPNDAGYQAMVDSIDLGLLGVTQ